MLDIRFFFSLGGISRPSVVLGVSAALATALACGGRGGGDGDGNGNDGSAGAGGRNGMGGPTEPVPISPGQFTYTLDESPSDLPLWTTPVANKIRTNDRAPGSTKSGLTLSAARNEFEPVQLVIGPASGNVTVTIAPFPNLGSGQRVELAVASYDQGWAENLGSLASGATVTLDGAAGTPVWLTVFVPKGAPPGEHSTTLGIERGGATTNVPVSLYVFDFDLPDEIHFSSQLNLDISSLLGSGSVDDAKTMLFEHRFTPKSVTWPSGFNWNITWDSGSNPNRCTQFYDEPDEGPEFAIHQLSKRYILGENWNDIGFPNAMIFQFVDNSTPRPDTFCGEARGDHFGTNRYNAEWSAFLSGLDDYLVSNGMADKAYHYVQNEPQDADDDRLAAHLCRLSRAAAPNLRIAISEEPKARIAEDADGACGYDIWIAHAPAFEQGYANVRKRDFGEELWFYSLDQDADPYFNPTVIDTQGMHQRIIPWAAWSHRITGWAFYDMNRFFSGTAPGVRAELFREGFEDYEYLWLANGGAHPAVDVEAFVDPTTKSVAASMTSWTRDADALMAVRHELGLFIEGTRDTLPTLSSDTGARERGSYYINFQDPNGMPSADPLIVDGNEYLKVGWEAWADDAGLGWFGENVGSNIVMFGYESSDGFDELERSYVYDDFGRKNLFEFALESGRYRVTIGAGNPRRGYAGDPHNVTVEGVPLIVEHVTTDSDPTVAETAEVDLTDGKLSIEMGGRSTTTGEFAFTFLAFARIEPVN